MTDKPSKPPRSLRGDDPAKTRRDVLGVIGFAGAAVTLGGVAGHLTSHPAPKPAGPQSSVALNKPYVPGAEHFATREEKWVKTSCAQCTAGCGIRVRVVEGRAVRIEGNPENPINRGGIGPRGLSGLQALYDADRITGPMARDASGNLVPIAWDRAIAMVTEKLVQARATAPDSVLVMTGRERGMMHDLWQRFAQAYGTPHFVDGSPSRSATLAQAMKATLQQNDLPTFDWAHADFVLSLGAGVLEDSCQLVYLARSAADSHRGRGIKRTTIVQAGPTFDLSANAADEWIPIRTGSNAALALGIAHVLVRDKLGVSTFPQESGFAEFGKWVLAEFPPAKVAELTGVPAERIEKLAVALVANRPSFVYADERSFAFTNGWETALAVLSLNALLGALGTLVRVEPKAPVAEWSAVVQDERAKASSAKPRMDGAGTPAYPLARAVHETLPDAILKTPPAVLILDHANPLYARHQPERWKKALAAVPFVVSFSPFRDESVDALAHLVLPDHTYLERWDDSASSPGSGIAIMGVKRPVIRPLHDTRSTGDVLMEIARGIGGTVAQSFPWKDARAALDERLLGLHAQKRGSIVERSPAHFISRIYAEGYWSDAEQKRPELPPFVFQRAYADPEWQGDAGAFPLKLVAYRPVGYAEGSGANLPWLRQLRSRPGTIRTAETPASVHPDAVPGLTNGAAIKVESAFGEIEATVRLDPRIPVDTIAIPMGQGHEAFGRWAKGRGGNVMRLLAAGAGRLTGQNLHATTRVKVSPGRSA
jgi:anaerobic selenocysteine-containing dehydrogenase